MKSHWKHFRKKSKSNQQTKQRGKELEAGNIDNIKLNKNEASYTVKIIFFMYKLTNHGVGVSLSLPFPLPPSRNSIQYNHPLKKVGLGWVFSTTLPPLISIIAGLRTMLFNFDAAITHWNMYWLKKPHENSDYSNIFHLEWNG